MTYTNKFVVVQRVLKRKDDQLILPDFFFIILMKDLVLSADVLEFRSLLSVGLVKQLYWHKGGRYIPLLCFSNFFPPKFAHM